MGLFLRQQGQLGDSLRWYDRAVALNPERWDYWNALCPKQISLGLEDLVETCVEGFEASSPEFGIGMRLQLYVYQRRFEDAEALISKMKEDGLNDLETFQLIGYYFNAGDAETGFAMLREQFPDEMENKDFVVEMGNVELAAVTGTMLLREGEIDHGNALLDQCLELINSMNRLIIPGYEDLDLYIHVARVDLALARLTLRDLIRERVIESSWLYDRAPILAELRADPESTALLEELNEVVAEQRQWYLDHKDEPLF
jgi:tetratricopeptide (TPR) repeat protein